nr:MAG TPA: hypothetical protein [Caudoviricetes sp.]
MVFSCPEEGNTNLVWISILVAIALIERRS